MHDGVRDPRELYYCLPAALINAMPVRDHKFSSSDAAFLQQQINYQQAGGSTDYSSQDPGTVAPNTNAPERAAVSQHSHENTADAADMGFDALSQAEAIDVDEEEVSQPGDRELC